MYYVCEWRAHINIRYTYHNDLRSTTSRHPEPPTKRSASSPGKVVDRDGDRQRERESEEEKKTIHTHFGNRSNSEVGTILYVKR